MGCCCLMVENFDNICVQLKRIIFVLLKVLIVFFARKNSTAGNFIVRYNGRQKKKRPLMETTAISLCDIYVTVFCIQLQLAFYIFKLYFKIIFFVSLSLHYMIIYVKKWLGTCFIDINPNLEFTLFITLVAIDSPESVWSRIQTKYVTFEYCLIFCLYSEYLKGLLF